MATTIPAANPATTIDATITSYTSAVTHVTIPSIYYTYKETSSKDFLQHESLSTLWFNYKNHFRTEQIVALAADYPIDLKWLLKPIGPHSTVPLKPEFSSPVEYHKALTDAVVAHLKAESGYDGTRARSNIEAEKISDLVFTSTKACSLRIFHGDNSGTSESDSVARSSVGQASLKATGQEGIMDTKIDTSQRNRTLLKTRSMELAPHLVEYFSYLPIVAAAHVLGDIASTSPYYWYAHQVATLVLVTDAITEYNIKERSTPYGTIFQAMTANLLNELKDFENVFQAITSFSLTTVQSIPSVIDAKFWSHDSDLEHPIDQIVGSEQNAALCLLRGMFLQCLTPFTLTVLSCPQTVETSRRLYRYLRESKRVTSRLHEDATIVCSCETSICFRPKLVESTRSICYSITSQGLPCSRRVEVFVVCLVWFVSVLATFFGLIFSPEVVDKYHLDPAGTASLVVLYMGMVVSGYKMLRTDMWSWYDFVRGRYYSKSVKDCAVPIDIPTVIRIINDDRRHFAPLTLRARNSFLLDDRTGCLEFDIGITMDHMREAGMMTYTDGSATYIFDPFRRGRHGLTLYRILLISNNVYHIDDIAVEKVKPIRLCVLRGVVA
ncbi:hypothetical protein BGX26_001888 [Mortierella sp. AD094]|nr:hypothetical protein BGX26_001888 [Mortierella sp. AD094]